MRVLIRIGFLALLLAIGNRPASAQVATSNGNHGLGCSNRTVQGAWAIQGSGSFVPPGTALPFVLGQAIPVNFQNLGIFDGKGKVVLPTGVDVIGGIIERNVPNSGSYSVNSDCSGEMRLLTEHSPDLGGPHEHHIHLMVADDTIYFTFMDPGATGSAIGKLIR
ncbi:MAG TPA: hypothetical protein VJR29_03165 [bacterium]|nr:hypothetical protein [bacterium]